MSAHVSYLPCGCVMPTHDADGKSLPEWERDLLHHKNCPATENHPQLEESGVASEPKNGTPQHSEDTPGRRPRVELVEFKCSPLRAALIAIFSMHMPVPDPFPDDPYHIGCSCGATLYMGHMPALIEARVATMMLDGDL